jgi:hypothetical protein
VEIRYRRLNGNGANWRRVNPYGFLHGHRHYLVAFHVNTKANKIALFRLTEPLFAWARLAPALRPATPACSQS